MDQKKPQNPVVSVSANNFLMDPVWVRAVRQADLLIGAVSRNDLDAVHHLIDTGINPNQGNAWDERPLHYAAKLEKPGPMIDLLIAQGADPTCADHIQNGPIHWAAIYRNAAAVDALIAHPTKPTDPNMPGQLRQTPLLIAIEQGDVPTADILLQHPKIAPEQSNVYGTDAWKMAATFCPKYAGQNEAILNLLKMRLVLLDTGTVGITAASNLDHWRSQHAQQLASEASTRTRPNRP